MEAQVLPMPSEIFENAIQQGIITRIELHIFEAAKKLPIRKSKNAPDVIKEILRRMFLMYGINPNVQFADLEFKKMFVEEVANVVVKYYPNMSRESFELALELNLTNYFQLEKKPEIYGDRVTANFLMEVLNVYRIFAGRIVQKCEKLIPMQETEPNLHETRKEVRQMMEQDFEALRGGIEKLRLPDMYYDLLVEDGEIHETPTFLRQYRDAAADVIMSMRNQAKMKERAPRNLKELDIARHLINTPKQSLLVSTAKRLAVIDYVNKTTHERVA